MEKSEEVNIGATHAQTSFGFTSKQYFFKKNEIRRNKMDKKDNIKVYHK